MKPLFINKPMDFRFLLVDAVRLYSVMSINDKPNESLVMRSWHVLGYRLVWPMPRHGV